MRPDLCSLFRCRTWRDGELDGTITRRGTTRSDLLGERRAGSSKVRSGRLSDSAKCGSGAESDRHVTEAAARDLERFAAAVEGPVHGTAGGIAGR